MLEKQTNGVYKYTPDIADKSNPIQRIRDAIRIYHTDFYSDEDHERAIDVLDEMFREQINEQLIEDGKSIDDMQARADVIYSIFNS